MTTQVEQNIARIEAATASGRGMDLILVSTTSPAQADYWQERLLATRGQVCTADATVVVVHEDWPGGAGNGLGTLYAIRQADEVLAERGERGVLERLAAGQRAALYHTAGKGTRLAPLPGCEINNKPGVKLPALVEVDGSREPLTILEAVIRQTAPYAASRAGRLSVFWGDQVFIPAAPVEYKARFHADILAQLGEMPDADSWEAQGLDAYGLIAVGADGAASQVEKISHATAVDLAQRGVIGVEGGVGVSLGSFSISRALTAALLAEFADELDRREGKLDTDPHFWMPMTLDADTYRRLMDRKGIDAATADAHYERLQALCRRVLAAHPAAGILGAVDIGTDCYWWDYGKVPDYHANNLKLTGDGPESEAMRRFFGISDRHAHSHIDADVDDRSVILGSELGGGRVRRSVLVGVRTPEIDVEDCILVAMTAPAIRAANALLYQVVDKDPVTPPPRQVRADIFHPDSEPLRLCTDLDRDGKADWEECLPGNPLSYAELHARNQNIDPRAARAAAAAAHRDADA